MSALLFLVSNCQNEKLLEKIFDNCVLGEWVGGGNAQAGCPLATFPLSPNAVRERGCLIGGMHWATDNASMWMWKQEEVCAVFQIFYRNTSSVFLVRFFINAQTPVSWQPMTFDYSWQVSFEKCTVWNIKMECLEDLWKFFSFLQRGGGRRNIKGQRCTELDRLIPKQPSTWKRSRPRSSFLDQTVGWTINICDIL